MTEQPPSGYGYNAPPPPQPVPGAARPGELVDRFVARFIDGIIIAFAYFILSLILSPIFLRGYLHSTGEVFVFYAVLGIIISALSLGYFGFLESTRGQTVGKMVMKLKTVGPTGANPTMAEAIKRNIFYAAYLLLIIPILGGFAAWAILLVAQILIAVGINNDTVNRQAWHDHFAGGTRVLKIG